MRLITYQSKIGPRVAGLRNEAIIDLNEVDREVPSCIKALLAQGPEGIARAEAALRKGRPLRLSPHILPPIPNPEKVVCVGLNYADHAKETGMVKPSEPICFAKLPSALTSHESPIILPQLSREVDFEAELVVVIGRGGRHIQPERAAEHIGGYCCGNDVSARDWQLHKPGGQWLMGKSFDSFAPIGPAIVTPDEIPDPNCLKIQLRLNGQTMQNSSTSQFLFSVAKVVSYVSSVATLKPGDLIFTGTPAGVGLARNPPLFLKPGDTVEVEIETIGVLRNPVIGDSDH